MSIIVSSTTDTQEQVNQAAGITSGTTPVADPSEAPDQEQTGDSEPPDTTDHPEEEQEDPEDAQKREHTNVQRRIDRLTRDKYELRGQVRELERRLSEHRQSAATPPQPGAQPASPQTAPTGEPQESQFQSYEQYTKALARWEARQELQQVMQEQQAREAQRQMAEAQQAWHGRVQQYASTIPDFQQTLEAVEHLELSPVLQHTILTHEDGPRLAYELAKRPDELERLAMLPPQALNRALGQFEGKYLTGENPPPKPAARSNAPPPIRPVGQGATRSTKGPDEMNYREFKAWRQKNGAR